MKRGSAIGHIGERSYGGLINPGVLILVNCLQRMRALPRSLTFSAYLPN